MAKLVGFIKISSLSSHFYDELHEYGQTPNNNASAFADALYHISAPSRLHHMPLPRDMVSSERWKGCPCEHTFLNIVHHSAFLQKRRNQKCRHCVPLRGNRRVLTHSRGSNAAPGAAPLSDVQSSARQSATFCRFVCVTKCG